MTATRSIFASLLTAAMLAAPATAQANRFVPADAQIVMRLAAPARWQADFANTKIANVLGGQGLAPMLGQLQAGMQLGLQQMKESGKIDTSLIERLLSDYKGDIVVGLKLDLEDLPMAIAEGRTPSIAMSIALTPDGEYPLQELADAIGKLAEEEAPPEALRDVTIAGHTLRATGDEDAGALLPAIIDGQLVVVFATDVERDGASMLAAENRHPATAEGKSMSLHIDLDQAMTTMLDFIDEQMANDPMAPPIDVRQMMQTLGLAGLRSLDVGLEADGEHAILETAVQCDTKEPGLLGCIMLDQGAPKLLRYVPPSTTAFGCQAFDINAIYDTVAKIGGMLEGLTPMSFTDLEQMFAETTKVRLKEDLFGNIGKEMLYLSDPEAAEDVDLEDPTAMFAGSCYGFALRDGKAFGEALETALRSRGLHAARKTEDYQGAKVHRMTFAGIVELEYAVTDDLLLLAIGNSESAKRQLRGVLDARAADEPGLPEAVSKHLDGAAEGWNGIAVSPLASTMAQVSRLLQQMPPGDMPPEMSMVAGMLGMLGQEMKQAGLDEVVQFTWAKAGSLRTLTRF